jgi:predicted TIM-barrel fold metal-dependent hydrolase
MLYDVHQHVWTEPLLDALARRETLPFVRRSHGLTVVYARDEQPYVVDVEAESPARRGALLRADGLDRACVALSSPLGIEALPSADADALIQAHLEGVEALPDGFSAWVPLSLRDPDPAGVDRAVARPRCIGVSLPAGALAGPVALQHVAPLLARIEERGIPLFVHPGPGTAPPGSAPAFLGEPLWWRPLTDYVAQMQAAWLAFTAIGRREHPRLVIVYALLAGGAPLLCERLASRGGPAIDVTDRNSFYDISSYGPAAIEAMARRVGPEQLVYGSDRPVVEPAATGRERVLQANAGRLLGAGERVAA